MEYIDMIYKIIEFESRDSDAIYEDRILEVIGFSGLNILKAKGLIKTCGVINGRKLYALVKKES